VQPPTFEPIGPSTQVEAQINLPFALAHSFLSESLGDPDNLRSQMGVVPFLTHVPGAITCELELLPPPQVTELVGVIAEMLHAYPSQHLVASVQPHFCPSLAQIAAGFEQQHARPPPAKFFVLQSDARLLPKGISFLLHPTGSVVLY
jgi:hypothetical protein